MCIRDRVITLIKCFIEHVIYLFKIRAVRYVMGTNITISVQYISAGSLEHTLFGCPGLEFADVILSLNNPVSYTHLQAYPVLLIRL